MCLENLLDMGDKRCNTPRRRYKRSVQLLLDRGVDFSIHWKENKFSLYYATTGVAEGLRNVARAMAVAGHHVQRKGRFFIVGGRV